MSNKRAIDQAAADRASGKQITFRRGEEVQASECVSTAQTCPSCKGHHAILPIVNRDSHGHAWLRCPVTQDSMVETPAGIFLPAQKSFAPPSPVPPIYQPPSKSPFELDEEEHGAEEAVAPLPDRPSIHAEKTLPTSVFSAVHAKIKQEHSQASFTIAKGLRDRLKEVEKENQHIDKEIERLQKLRASLTTEQLWLKKSVEEFRELAEDETTEAPDHDSDPALPEEPTPTGPKQKTK